jgi:hypothetical protein
MASMLESTERRTLASKKSLSITEKRPENARTAKIAAKIVETSKLIEAFCPTVIAFLTNLFEYFQVSASRTSLLRETAYSGHTECLRVPCPCDRQDSLI